MKQPKVEVCVVTYNQEMYVGSCLESIINQETTFPFQVIVSDDCSTDRTCSIIQDYAERYPELIRTVFRTVNIGALNNLVETHNSATAEYVAHIDGDDLMLPGKLQKQAEFLDANPNFSVVWHRVNFFNDDGRFSPGEDTDISFYPEGVVTLEHSLRLGSVAAHSSVMYRKSVRKTTKSEFPVIDLYYTWEFLSAGKGKILSDVLGSYRVQASGSMMHSVGVSNIETIVAQHAEYYLRLMPWQRRNIFSMAFLRFLVAVKNRRSSARDFGKLALRSVSFVSPFFLLRNMREMQKLPKGSI